MRSTATQVLSAAMIVVGAMGLVLRGGAGSSRAADRAPQGGAAAQSH